jgi:Phosphotransferase enzyme family
MNSMKDVISSKEKSSADTNAKSPGFECLTAMGLDVRNDIRRAVKDMMLERMSEQFIASCVRTQEFQAWGGGYKSELVGRLKLSVVAGLKLGGPELHRDAAIMREINAAGASICIEPLHVTDIHNGKSILLMEGLEKHCSLLDVVYFQPVLGAVQDRLVKRIVNGLAQIRKVLPATLAEANVPITVDPYSDRLRSKVLGTLAEVEELGGDSLLSQPGLLDGKKCPPVADLVHDACTWLTSNTKAIQPVLAHGDLHMKNILVRRRGGGYSFRFIDPNGEIGFTDALYDVGKLLHWAEKLGWSQANKDVCKVKWSPAGRNKLWRLTAGIGPSSQAAEHRRQRLKSSILRLTEPLWEEPNARPRLHLSVASAHAGLLNLYAKAGNYDMARFATYFTLRSLLRWKKDAGKY